MAKRFWIFFFQSRAVVAYGLRNLCFTCYIRSVYAAERTVEEHDFMNETAVYGLKKEKNIQDYVYEVRF